MIDPFWGPFWAFVAVMVVGGVIAGLGSAMQESATTRDDKQSAGVILGLGAAIASVGVVPMIILLITTCWQKCF